jgi:hypothetical protein
VASNALACFVRSALEHGFEFLLCPDEAEDKQRDNDSEYDQEPDREIPEMCRCSYLVRLVAVLTVEYIKLCGI